MVNRNGNGNDSAKEEGIDPNAGQFYHKESRLERYPIFTYPEGSLCYVCADFKLRIPYIQVEWCRSLKNGL